MVHQGHDFADPGRSRLDITGVASGMAVQAAGGVDREEPQATADAAVRNWPPC